ncbi:MAG: hypothetical protein ABN482_06355 [Corticimicrobacter sp.]|uniref:hypothetical protein n=1 Tax=Corticimicrobacter sp. TaxID=2678536 RepID=UPI0032D9B6ED
MADLDLYKVDLNTPQPGGRVGESPRAAFTKYNDALDALRSVVEHVGASAPPNPVAYMQWLDTSVSPAMIRRRNAANTDWVAIMPALQALGTAAFANLTTSVTDTTAGRVIRVGDFGIGGRAAVIPGANFDTISAVAGFFGIPANANSPFGASANVVNFGGFNDYEAQLGIVLAQKIAMIRQKIGGVWADPYELFHTANCTVTGNANGVSYRFPNGLQICFSVLPAVVATTAQGALFASLNQTWDFPQSFIAAPATSAVSGTINGWANGTGQTTTSANFRRWSITSHNVEMPILVSATGRYK